MDKTNCLNCGNEIKAKPGASIISKTPKGENVIECNKCNHYNLIEIGPNENGRLKIRITGTRPIN